MGQGATPIQWWRRRPVYTYVPAAVWTSINALYVVTMDSTRAVCHQNHGCINGDRNANAPVNPQMFGMTQRRIQGSAESLTRRQSSHPNLQHSNVVPAAVFRAAFEKHQSPKGRRRQTSAHPTRRRPDQPPALPCRGHSPAPTTTRPEAWRASCNPRGSTRALSSRTCTAGCPAHASTPQGFEAPRRYRSEFAAQPQPNLHMARAIRTHITGAQPPLPPLGAACARTPRLRRNHGLPAAQANQRQPPKGDASSRIAVASLPLSIATNIPRARRLRIVPSPSASRWPFQQRRPPRQAQNPSTPRCRTARSPDL